jgi:hypothetical protein
MEKGYTQYKKENMEEDRNEQTEPPSLLGLRVFCGIETLMKKNALSPFL